MTIHHMIDDHMTSTCTTKACDSMMVHDGPISCDATTLKRSILKPCTRPAIESSILYHINQDTFPSTKAHFNSDILNLHHCQTISWSPWLPCRPPGSGRHRAWTPAGRADGKPKCAQLMPTRREFLDQRSQASCKHVVSWELVLAVMASKNERILR
jgi:hypothetical protein